MPIDLNGTQVAGGYPIRKPEAKVVSLVLGAFIFDQTLAYGGKQPFLGWISPNLTYCSREC
jgi:hypothetical protein